MTGARNNGTRKGLRAIPLTKRQRKQGAPASAAFQRARSAPAQVKIAHGPGEDYPALVLSAPIAPAAPSMADELLAPTAPLVLPRPASPLDFKAESRDTQALSVSAQPEEPLDMQDTVQLSVPPSLETPTVIKTSITDSGEPNSSPQASATPRRVKVRVRRRYATPEPQVMAPKINAEMEETVILPKLAEQQDSASGISLNIVLDSETVQLTYPQKRPPARANALDIETVQLNPSVARASTRKAARPTTEPAPATKTPNRDNRDDGESDALPISPSASEPALDAPSTPRDLTPASAMDMSEASEAADAPSDEEPTQRLAVTSRKLPTLAVMAALAPRPEPRIEPPIEPRDPVSDGAAPLVEPSETALVAETPEQRAASTPAPALEPALEPIMEFALEAAPSAEPALAPGVSDEALLSELRAMLDASTISSTTDNGASQAGPRRRAPATTRPLASTSREELTSGARRIAQRMWGLAASPRAQTKTREERGAPVNTSAPATPEAPSERGAQAPWLKPETSHHERPARSARPTPLLKPEPKPAPAPRVAPAFTRSLNQMAGTAWDRSWPYWARPSGKRSRMQERAQDREAHVEETSALLPWAGIGQATLCGLAAFVAAIALLNGSAGAQAVRIFAWAITFALLAGVGAGLEYLAWRAKRVRLATTVLLLSQLSLLIWAFLLLGARPALMAFVPFSVALALLGIGRLAAAMSGMVALALYALTLTLNLTGMRPPVAQPGGVLAALIDTMLVVAGIALIALAQARLFADSEREWARTRASERAARLAARELETLRTQTEDDANTLRQALANALRGVPTEGVGARGALSPLAEQVSVVAERLVDLSYDREERKRLESATRRLIRNIERAWLGLSWEWPEPSGVILDDLVALLRTPTHGEPLRLPEDTTPTAQVVAPHLYRAWQPGSSTPSYPSFPSMPSLPTIASISSLPSAPSQPLNEQMSLWPGRAAPSQPSGVWQSLWPSDPEPAPPGTDPLALPPGPRWRGPGDLNGFGSNGGYPNEPSSGAVQ